MEVGGVVCGVTWKWDVRGCKGVSLASPAARRAYYGSTYYGTTYYGSTYYGSTSPAARRAWGPKSHTRRRAASDLRSRARATRATARALRTWASWRVPRQLWP